MARRGKFGKAALLMGAAAMAAGVLLKRDKVAGLLSPGSRDGPEPSWTAAPAPAPANYDAPGPVANPSTPVPAPDPFVREEDGSIDEQAEEAAAAAEAANIGGQVSDYAGVQDPDLGADEADRPLVEAGDLVALEQHAGRHGRRAHQQRRLPELASPSHGSRSLGFARRLLAETVPGATRPAHSALGAVLGRLRQLGGLGVRRGAVLVAHGGVDLLAVDRDGPRRADAHADGVADDLHDLDDDVVADHDALACAAGDDEHCAFLLGKSAVNGL